jgi:hypothetical protein
VSEFNLQPFAWSLAVTQILNEKGNVGLHRFFVMVRAMNMPFCKISRDVKIAAINLHDTSIFPVEDLCQLVGFSVCTFWCIHRLWVETGNVVTHKYGYRHGQTCILHIDNVQYLI